MSANRRRIKKTQIRRRTVLKGMLACCGVPAIVPVRVLGANVPSNRITLGCIGVGGQGTSRNLASFLKEQDAQVLAVCDVFDARRERARTMVNEKYRSSDCKSFVDFRRILQNDHAAARHFHLPCFHRTKPRDRCLVTVLCHSSSP